MDQLKRILHHYNILPQAFERVTDRLTKVKADGRQYALKRSKLHLDTIKNWESVYHTAAQKSLYEIVPIYLTQQKQLYLEEEGEYYYLMPWIEDIRAITNENHISSIYSQLGKIHVQTKSMYDLNKEKVEENFNQYKISCQENEKKLLQVINQIEQIHYPSPLQLQVLTYYRDLQGSLQRSQALVNRVISLTETESLWGISLNHGSLARDHMSEHYIINWERATYQHAVFDLKDLLQTEVVNAPHLQNEYIQSFSAYLEENPLTELEKCLMCLYLLNVDEYLDYIDTHVTREALRQSHIDSSIELEQLNRKLVFGLRFDSQIERIAPSKENAD